MKVSKHYFENHSKAETHFHRLFKPKQLRVSWYRIHPSEFNKEARLYKSWIKEFEVEAREKKKQEKIENAKKWHVIYGASSYKCEFIHFNHVNSLLRLKCLGKKIRVQLNTKKCYSEAKNGNERICKALSSKGNKIIKVVFK